MSKMKRMVASVVVATSFCLAGLPLMVFAETACTDGVQCSENDDLNVTINVSSMISMRLVSYSELTPMTMNCDSTQKTSTSDGCSGSQQQTLTTLLPSSSNVTDNTSTAYTRVYVSTNSPSGYVLTLIDADENTNMVNGSGATISAINQKPVATTTPGWAVSVDGNGWQRMKHNSNTAGTIVAETPITVTSYNPTASSTMSALVSDRLSTVYYGYATSSSQATGQYVDTVEYTATAQ